MNNISPWRADFDIPQDITYLNAAFMTPPPRQVIAAGHVGVDVKAQPWKLTRATFYDDVERARAEVAGLINARPDDIAIVGSTSYGIATAARNLTIENNTVILGIAGEHPSQTYAWMELAQKNSAYYEQITRDEDQSWADALIARIKSSDKAPVSILALTQVHWADGSEIDLVAVSAAAREHSIALVIDATQSAGVMKLDVEVIKPDFIAFATYKWLLGPYGLAFLYAAPWQQDGEPLEQHAFSRAGADGYSNHYDRALTFMPGARRYDTGERSNLVTVPMANESVSYLKKIGQDVIENHIRTIVDSIAEHAKNYGVTTIKSPYRSAHLLGLRGADDFSDEFVSFLGKDNIIVSARDGIVRVAPHIYSGAEDVERFADALARYFKRSNRRA